MIAYTQSLLVDRKSLNDAQLNNDVALCQEILQGAYRMDIRALVAEARLHAGGALNPIDTYRKMNVRKELINTRGTKNIATGL